jgi:trk system potassium uptake protein TrkA
VTRLPRTVVVGCGRLGAILAERLSRQGADVVVIDRDERAFDGLDEDFGGFTVHGDATRRAVLDAAGTADAEVVVAVTHEDNVNLMVAQVAQRIYGVPRVLARVYDPKRQETYAHLGVETVCPTTVAADRLLTAVGANDPPSSEGRP